MAECPFCSNETSKIFHTGTCPRVKSIEYYENGKVKRIEFKDDPLYVRPPSQPIIIQPQIPDWLKPPYTITSDNVTAKIPGMSVWYSTGGYRA